MADYINTPSEIFAGDSYFKQHVKPDDFDVRSHKKELSPYFEKFGFKASMMYLSTEEREMTCVDAALIVHITGAEKGTRRRENLI